MAGFDGGSLMMKSEVSLKTSNGLSDREDVTKWIGQWHNVANGYLQPIFERGRVQAWSGLVGALLALLLTRLG